MARSGFYLKLNDDLKSFRKIIARNPATTNDSDLHHLKVRSFILLAHTAFEAYLEDLAKDLLEKSVDKFLKSRVYNPCISCLIAFETVAQFDESASRKAIKSSMVAKIQDFVAIAKNNHLSDIKGNNGIKLKDQKKMFIPVGLDPEEIDLPTANALDAFGEKRGGVAHQPKIHVADTRSSVETEVRTILSGLVQFDAAYCDAIAKL